MTEDLPSSSTCHDSCSQDETPFQCLAHEAARRVPFMKAAASTLCDLLRECPLIGNGTAQRQALRAVHEIYQEMLELEEALGQLPANGTR